jgi:hypothetical protein
MREDVAHMGDRRGVHNVLVGKGRRHLENLSVDERITLKWILKIGFEGRHSIHLVQDK